MLPHVPLNYIHNIMLQLYAIQVEQNAHATCMAITTLLDSINCNTV